MSAFLTALRWDVVLQARNGFYWASGFVVLVIGGLLLAVPETVRSNQAALVPAILAINLQITTFFFVAGLMLLERDEGTLTALAVSPLSPGALPRHAYGLPDGIGRCRNGRLVVDRVRHSGLMAAS